VEEHDEITITLRVGQDQALELLRRLAEDDDFRREIESSPAQVLASYGIEITPPEAIPPRAQLASKEQIGVLLDAMMTEDDPLGRVSHGAWRYQLLPNIFTFGALPMIGRGDPS
jgi:putative modified peptide